MNARRLTLVIASAVVILSLMTSYLGNEETAADRRVPVASRSPIPTAPAAAPGEVTWASWHEKKTTPNQDAGPVLRDLYVAEERYEDLPEEIRARLERDYVGLDVVLPRRNR